MPLSSIVIYCMAVIFKKTYMATPRIVFNDEKKNQLIFVDANLFEIFCYVARKKSVCTAKQNVKLPYYVS